MWSDRPLHRQYRKNSKRIYEPKNKFFKYLAKKLLPHKKVELYRNIKPKNDNKDYL
tara:strand:- start:536 stop:703 length:168 start_codon:yes stop_codon:yes gene_type:complete